MAEVFFENLFWPLGFFVLQYMWNIISDHVSRQLPVLYCSNLWHFTIVIVFSCVIYYLKFKFLPASLAFRLHKSVRSFYSHITSSSLIFNMFWESWNFLFPYFISQKFQLLCFYRKYRFHCKFLFYWKLRRFLCVLSMPF